MEIKPKTESKTGLKTKLKKPTKMIAFHFLKIMLAVAVAVTGSLPFLLWPEIIKKLAVAGYMGLFVACFLTNATVFLPASGIAFTISASTVLNPLFCTIIGGVGTACGELISYCCGRAGKNVVEDTPFLFRIQTYVQKYGVFTVWLFAFLPLPLFDLVGVTAGAGKMPLPKYIIPCMIGKVMKMMVYVFLVQRYLKI